MIRNAPPRRHAERLGAISHHVLPPHGNHRPQRPLLFCGSPAAAAQHVLERDPRWKARACGPLSPKQVQHFEDEGYLLLPGAFSGVECSALREEGEQMCQLEREEVWRESSGAARTAFAIHTYSKLYKKLVRHPRLLRPVEQLLDGQVYMHQSKVNAKAAFDGELWQWHQGDNPTSPLSFRPASVCASV